jgi:hypothetical protein
MKCDICGINPATIKNYVEIGDTIHKMPACGPCMSLNGKSVNTLMNSRQDRRLRLLKRWWSPDTRGTLLPKAYPAVEWTKVRI